MPERYQPDPTVLDDEADLQATRVLEVPLDNLAARREQLEIGELRVPRDPQVFSRCRRRIGEVDGKLIKD